MTISKPTEPRLILASTSPRRRDLLAAAGVDFRIEAARIEESTDPGLSAHDLCLHNAESKAGEVAGRFPGQIVLGADTVVSLASRTLGKPRDRAEARQMLEALCGRTHEVLTGVCLVHRDADTKRCFVESTRVTFRPRAEVNLDAYLTDIHPLDKAGAYAAQEDAGRLIERLEGSLPNVIGLPVETVLATLKTHFSFSPAPSVSSSPGRGGGKESVRKAGNASG